jgi:hypothetical protein
LYHQYGPAQTSLRAIRKTRIISISIKTELAVYRGNTRVIPVDIQKEEITWQF